MPIQVSREYRHFKGQHYKVLALAKCSETQKDLVVYQALYGNGQVWVRPLNMFLEEVTIGGKLVKRFELIPNDKRASF